MDEYEKYSGDAEDLTELSSDFKRFCELQSRCAKNKNDAGALFELGKIYYYGINVHRNEGFAVNNFIFPAAKLKNKDQVIILDDSIHLEEEPTYKDWYQIQFIQNGKTLVGYVSAEFVQIVGTSETVVANPAPLLSQRYKVEELFVAEIPAGTTLETFAAESSYEVCAFRADGTALAPEDVLYTGDEIRFTVENTIVATRTIAIMGDVNGNGKVDSADYVMVKRAVLKTLTVDAAALRAAAVTNGSSVSAADYVKIRRVVMGTYQFPS
jgi:hypothetical protein